MAPKKNLNETLFTTIEEKISKYNEWGGGDFGAELNQYKYYV